MSDQTTKLFDRIRALMAKAEATEFDGEREAFEAKAAAMMAEHAISREQLGDVLDSDPMETHYFHARDLHQLVTVKPNSFYVFDYIPSTYRPQMWHGFMSVARECFGLWCYYSGSKKYGYIAVVGRRSQIEAFKATMRLLRIQAHRELSKPMPEDEYWDHRSKAAQTKNYRRGVAIGFYRGVVDRFRSEVREHDRESGSNTLPALRSDVRQAQDWANIRTVNGTGASFGSGSGIAAGRSAGFASGGTTAGVGGGRSSLGSGR